jgi:hypothetical protein
MADEKKQNEEIDLQNITTAEEMLKLTADEKLNLAQLKTLIEIHPGIVKASIEAMQSLTKTSEVAGKSQIESIEALKASISGTLEVLKILAQNAQSDNTREKIAETLIELAKQHRELCQIIERMNKNNNNLWKKIALGIGGALLVVIGGIATAASKK